MMTGQNYSIEVHRGMGRVVLCVGELAIKLPSFRNGQMLFVQGMLSNLNESERWKLHRHPQLAEVYQCGPFGLWLIMKRYRHVINRRLTTPELKMLPFCNIDNNAANIAIDNETFVLVDYGNADWYYIAPTE